MILPLMQDQQCGFREGNMDRIYLDHAASMPVDPRVIDFIKPFLQNAGNPSSLYELGQNSRIAIEEARKNIADLINAENEKSIIFTGSATEANNIAIRGTALRNINDGKEVLSSAIEHISVINPMKDLQKNGWAFNTIPVDKFGLVDLLASVSLNASSIAFLLYLSTHFAKYVNGIPLNT